MVVFQHGRRLAPGFPRRPQGSAKEADPTAICRSDTAQCGSMFLGSMIGIKIGCLGNSCVFVPMCVPNRYEQL